MAKVLEFPRKHEWSGVEQKIGQIMRQAGHGDEAIRAVNERLMAYREKYLDFGFDIDIEGMPPDAVERIEAALRGFQTQLIEHVNAILWERIVTETRLLDLD